MIEFEWDARKASANAKKHGVTFPEAATIFGDKLAITYDDPDRSADEHRFVTFGMSEDGRLLAVSHTNRGDKVRIISSRLMTKGERRIYEEG